MTNKYMYNVGLYVQWPDLNSLLSQEWQDLISIVYIDT